MFHLYNRDNKIYYEMKRWKFNMFFYRDWDLECKIRTYFLEEKLPELNLEGWRKLSKRLKKKKKRKPLGRGNIMGKGIEEWELMLHWEIKHIKLNHQKTVERASILSSLTVAFYTSMYIYEMKFSQSQSFLDIHVLV